MNEFDAQKNGYHYCGPTISNYSTISEKECWELDIKFAQKIKKEYVDANYVIATGTVNSWLGSKNKGLFGNEVFNKIWDLLKYKHLDRTPEYIAYLRRRAEEEYQKAQDEINKEEQEYQKNLAFLESVKR